MDKSTALTAAILLISPAGVLALVNFGKKLGVAGSWALVLAFVLGIALNLAAWVSGIAYVGAPLFAVVAAGAIAGLTASGLWDATGGKESSLAPTTEAETVERVYTHDAEGRVTGETLTRAFNRASTKGAKG